MNRALSNITTGDYSLVPISHSRIGIETGIGLPANPYLGLAVCPISNLGIGTGYKLYTQSLDKTWAWDLQVGPKVLLELFWGPRAWRWYDRPKSTHVRIARHHYDVGCTPFQNIRMNSVGLWTRCNTDVSRNNTRQTPDITCTLLRGVQHRVQILDDVLWTT